MTTISSFFITFSPPFAKASKSRTYSASVSRSSWHSRGAVIELTSVGTTRPLAASCLKVTSRANLRRSPAGAVSGIFITISVACGTNESLPGVSPITRMCVVDR